MLYYRYPPKKFHGFIRNQNKQPRSGPTEKDNEEVEEVEVKEVKEVEEVEEVKEVEEVEEVEKVKLGRG